MTTDRHMQRQIQKQSENNTINQTTRKSPGQICVSSEKNNKPDSKRGKSPRRNRPRTGNAKDTVVKPKENHRVNYKNMQ